MHVTSPSQYWCQYHLVVTVEGPEGTHSVTVAKPFARVGADRSADVVLPQGRLPRRALYLHGTENGVFWVNLAELADGDGPLRGWLRAEEAILFGPYRISARLTSNGHAPALPLPDLCAKGTVPEPQPSLLIAFGDQPVACRRLSRRLTLVGRRRPSALRISSHDLSASHLVLYWEAGSIWVVDLLSRTGTKLDGETIEASPLPAGTWLSVGEVKLKHGRQYPASLSLSDSTVPLWRPLVPKETESEVPPRSAAASCTEETPEGPWSAVAPAEATRRRLETDRLELERERAAFAEEQQEARARVTAELARLKQCEAEFEGRQRELEARRRRDEEELARRHAALTEQESFLQRLRTEFDRQQAELESNRARIEAQRRAMEQEQAALAAEREALRTRHREEAARPLRETEAAIPGSAPHVTAQATPASKPPATTPGAFPENGVSNRDSSEDDSEARYDAVMDRLFKVSRARRSWWSRFRSNLSRRSADDQPSQPSDLPDPDGQPDEME